MVRTGYHLVDNRPWPFRASLGVLGLTSSFVGMLHLGLVDEVCFFLIISLFILFSTVYQWWGDVVLERTYLGCHTSLVVRNLRSGFILFILSEVFFFVRFFWAYFHCRIGEASINKVGHWPPLGVKAIDPWKIPALNTAVLLGSGARVTWAHKALNVHNYYHYNIFNNPVLEGSLKRDSNRVKEVKNFEFESKDKMADLYRLQTLVALGITVVLGVFFTWLQAGEYFISSFSIADGAYGATFFIITGFHGMHVLIGTAFLIVCWIRTYLYHFRDKHHYFGFDAAVWYWHFVDVVWIGLYGAVYVWGFY